jgi:hypothetical protein
MRLRDEQMVLSAIERCRSYPNSTRTENEDVIVLLGAEIERLRAALGEICAESIDGSATRCGLIADKALR